VVVTLGIVLSALRSEPATVAEAIEAEVEIA
jgi:hypothetical protein